MDTKDNSLMGALTGLAVTAAGWWSRYDEDTQRRLRNTRADIRDALELIRELNARGEVHRSRLPTVQDAFVGLSLSSPQPTAPAFIPSTTPSVRPDLTSQMETAVGDMSWPPEPGDYDSRGLVKRAGELTSMFLALTFEEVRAFVQGMAQPRSPGREAKLQIFYAVNALVATLCEKRLTWDQYRTLWGRLLTPELHPTELNPRPGPTP